MNIAAWLLAMVGPLAIRVLTTVGFSAVTFVGVQLIVDSLISLAQTHWSAMPLAALQLASLAGVPEGMGLICGAFVARVTLYMAQNATKLLFTGRAA